MRFQIVEVLCEDSRRICQWYGQNLGTSSSSVITRWRNPSLGPELHRLHAQPNGLEARERYQQAKSCITINIVRCIRFVDVPIRRVTSSRAKCPGTSPCLEVPKQIQTIWDDSAIGIKPVMTTMENDSIRRARGRDRSHGGLPRSGLHGSGADGCRCRWGRREGQKPSGQQRLIRKARAELDERFQIQFSKDPRLNLYDQTLEKAAPASVPAHECCSPRSPSPPAVTYAFHTRPYCPINR